MCFAGFTENHILRIITLWHFYFIDKEEEINVMKQKSRTLRGCLRCVDLFGKCLMFFDLNGEMVKKKKVTITVASYITLEVKTASWWQLQLDYQSFIPCWCPSAFHQQQRLLVRGGTNCLWFDSLSPDGRLRIHFIYSSVCPSGMELLAGGWRKEMVELEDKERRNPLPDSGFGLLFLAKAAIITRATSNKIVQARLGN